MFYKETRSSAKQNRDLLEWRELETYPKLKTVEAACKTISSEYQRESGIQRLEGENEGVGVLGEG